MNVAQLLEKGLALQRAGRYHEAETTYALIIASEPDNAAALHYCGLACMQQNDLARGDSLLSRAAALDPRDANTLADLGAVKAKRQEYESSVALLSRALEIEPDHADALHNLAAVYEVLQRPESALPLLEAQFAIQPESARNCMQLAQVCFRLGDGPRAVSLLQDAIAIDPAFSAARLLLGEVLEALGRFRAAHAQYLHALRRNPHDAAALARLLQLRDATISPRWLERAGAALQDKSLPRADYVRLRIAMGFYYDRASDYDRAFENFHAGYELQHQKKPFDVVAYGAVVNRLIRCYSSGLFARFAGRESPVCRPIFIFGMPRSGTTLVEQILASHPAVAAGGELSTLMAIASQLNSNPQGGRAYPEGLWDMGDGQLEQMRARYLSRLDRISKSAARVTDKQPFNYMHIGLAQLLFPRAAFINCWRDPLDTCTSCYFVSFADSFAFANDLTTLGRYYLEYARLMAHWGRVLPTPVLDVQYESLVTDFEGVAKRLVAHCGLPWDDACLRFYDTERMVRTPSRWQVRQPIYSNSVGRWKRYERHLGPLIAALGPLLREPA